MPSSNVTLKTGVPILFSLTGFPCTSTTSILELLFFVSTLLMPFSIKSNVCVMTPTLLIQSSTLTVPCLIVRVTLPLAFIAKYSSTTNR